MKISGGTSFNVAFKVLFYLYMLNIWPPEHDDLIGSCPFIGKFNHEFCFLHAFYPLIVSDT